MSEFQFKHFTISQKHAAQKVGTDSMILGAMAHWNAPTRLLDIGTGTGVLALMCAQRYRFKEILGIDISENACLDARYNALNSPFDSPISIRTIPLNELSENESFDAIISNPPFFENSLHKEHEEATWARHTSSLSFEDLVTSINRLLSPSGMGWIIVPFQAVNRILELTKQQHLHPHEIVYIEGKPKHPVRVIFALGKEVPHAIKRSELCIRDANGKYSDSYRQLTIEYHNRAI